MENLPHPKLRLQPAAFRKSGDRLYVARVDASDDNCIEVQLCSKDQDLEHRVAKLDKLLDNYKYAEEQYLRDGLNYLASTKSIRKNNVVELLGILTESGVTSVGLSAEDELGVHYEVFMVGNFTFEFDTQLKLIAAAANFA